ncbi:MAG: ABC transporter permease, partial [Rhabdochlamydiaceae bacterium]|nr:ABC transporter permease [Candidatus Amphrikana amoebophyrae]
MKVFIDVFQLFKRNMTATLRNPVFLFMGVFTPILYLTLFAPMLENFAQMKGFQGSNVLTTFIPGMLALIAFSGGLFAGFGIIDELRNGVLERMRVTPCSRFALMAGPVFRDVIAVLAQITVFILLAIPFGFKAHVGGLALALILLMMLVTTTSCFGNAMGLITKSEDHFAPVVHGINLPVILLSGMMLPMAMAPKWLQITAHFNPVYYVVEASRLLVSGNIL